MQACPTTAGLMLLANCSASVSSSLTPPTDRLLELLQAATSISSSQRGGRILGSRTAVERRRQRQQQPIQLGDYLLLMIHRKISESSTQNERGASPLKGDSQTIFNLITDQQKKANSCRARVSSLQREINNKKRLVDDRIKEAAQRILNALPEGVFDSAENLKRTIEQPELFSAAKQEYTNQKKLTS